ncbi:hypothetical protein AB1Y20_019000 [Prymnesium parvum]|uniref:PPM-type phosphatase domain-containing protein n=1 Tax=Prymnesium parvum TaxID=97485 RepID=A0AB34JRA2_PRYPA
MAEGVEVVVTGCHDGVGLELSEENVILQIEEGSAAHRSRLFALHDHVLAVDGEFLHGRRLCDVIAPAPTHAFVLARAAEPPSRGSQKRVRECPAAELPPPPSRRAASDGAGRSAVCTSLGSRPSQEDAYTRVDEGWASAEAAAWPGCRFYAVFDGHNGAGASTLAAQTLWEELRPRLREDVRAAGSVPSAQALRASLGGAFEATEAAVLRQAAHCGSTAVCALLLGDVLCVANLGDSRAVLCRAERAVRLTEDHKPNVPAEAARITAAGGTVTTPYARGTANVPRLNGVLSVSRALGDAPFKPALLSAEPDITVTRLSPHDRFVILASDGVWDVMSDDAAVSIVLRELQVRWPPRTSDGRAQIACDSLVREVLLTGHCRDNVTVVLAVLNDDD